MFKNWFIKIMARLLKPVIEEIEKQDFERVKNGGFDENKSYFKKWSEI